MRRLAPGQRSRWNRPSGPCTSLRLVAGSTPVEMRQIAAREPEPDCVAWSPFRPIELFPTQALPRPASPSADAPCFEGYSKVQLSADGFPVDPLALTAERLFRSVCDLHVPQ